MRAQLIKTVTRLIALYLANYDYKVVGRGKEWRWETTGRTSENFADELGAILSACEHVIRLGSSTATR